MSEMERTLDSIRPSDVERTRDHMSFLYGRDPSILAYGERPIPSSKQNLISLYEDEEDEYTDDTGSEAITLQTVKVYLRVKPLPRKLKLTKEETEAYQITNATTLLTKLPSLDHNASALKGPKNADMICRKFTFTKTFGPETTQLHLFEQVIQQKMVDFLAGQNSTVMTYGTTNSGKSYTLQGTTTSPGIIPRGLEFVFSNITARPTPSYKPIHDSDVVSLNAVDRAQELESKNKLLTFASIDKHHYINAYKQMQKLLQEESPIRPSQACDAQYSVWVSFAEIYNENIFDLLSNESQKRRPLLKLGTDSYGRAFIKGLKSICVNSGSEAYQVLMAGQYNLKVAATALNARSSRSHCIFTIKLLKYYVENSPEKVEVSTFAFCDLAGSERLKKTLNVGDRLKEAQNINTSLLVLGRCLKSIYEGQSIKQKHEHVGPFRESKLTRLFQHALSGKEQIALIVNVNPIPNLYVETQNVLNFSAIAKKIVVEPKQIKRRVSNSRFSQIVAQSVKSNTDWDETELSEVIEQTVESETDGSVFIHQDEFDDVVSENRSLKKELGTLKASMLKRDLQIRQELADTYTAMMKKLETDWKNRIRDVEEQQEDQLEWSVNRVETFYKEKISELTSRKRRRLSNDDSDEERRDVSELEIENTRLMGKILSLKKSIKHLRESNENAITEKNKLSFEFGLVNEELKSVKSLLSSAEDDLCRDGENRAYVEKLRTELSHKEAQIKKLKSFLNEAKDEYISITADAGAMEKRLKDQAEQLAESQERVVDLEELLEQVNVCLAEQTKATEALEEKLNQQSNLVHDVKVKEQRTQAKLLESEEMIRMLREKVVLLEKTPPRPESVTPDSMFTGAGIKEELLSESESDVSLDHPKTLPEGVIIKTDNEILGIPMTSYDDDRNSEVFVRVQEISVNEKLDESQLITELKAKLIESRTENESLKHKLARNRLEIDSLRESFEIVKNQLTNVDKQLSDYKNTKAIEKEMETLKTSLSQNTGEYENSLYQSENQAAKIEMMENGSQTAAISERDQTIQTSFVHPDNEDKSVQTMVVDDEKLVNSLKELKALRIEYDQLEAEFKKKELSIEKFKEEFESRKSEDQLETVRIKYDQLKAEFNEKEMLIEKLKEELENYVSSEDLKALKNKYDQLEVECKKKETMIKKLEEDLENHEKENELQVLRIEHNQLKDGCEKKDTLIKKLEGELSNHENELEVLRIQHNQLKDECEKKNALIKKLEEELDNHQSENELEGLMIEYNQLKDVCEKKDTLIKKLEKELDNHENENELEALRIQHNQLKDECEKKDTLIKKFEKELDNHETENELEGLMIEYNQLKDDCEKKDAMIKKLEEKLDNRDSEDELEKLRIKYDKLQCEYREKDALIKELQEELKNFHVSSNLEKDLASAVAEKEEIAKTLTETNELLKTLRSQVSKCREEYESKIADLEKELTVSKIREEAKSECIEVQTNKIAEIEGTFAVRSKEFENQITDMTKSLEQCKNEKAELKEKLKQNVTEIETLEKRCQLADKKEHEKDEEIRQLQKAIKNNLAADIHDKKMEKEMRQVLDELNETKEALARVDDVYHRLKSSSTKDIQELRNQISVLEEKKKIFEIREREAQESEEEIRRLKTENEELTSSLDEKDREMESFMKNRDEMIAKYESLVKAKQQELERGKREITRFQELFHRMPTTPRDKDTKPTDESLKAPIPVVDLSDSETKRTTRRQALAPPSNCPSSDVKRSTRKKRLYQPVDDSCIDLEVSESIPPTPSPASTRSLRTRRK